MMRSTRFDLDAQPTAQLPFPKVEKTMQVQHDGSRPASFAGMSRRASFHY